jgi:hypothetical protein
MSYEEAGELPGQEAGRQVQCAETVSIKINIPTEKYRKLRKMADITGYEFMSFINGTAVFSSMRCSNCPVWCTASDAHNCKARFLLWLFTEGETEEGGRI